MASGSANINVGVTGVSQFKQDINALKQSMKTLDMQLKLNEQEFKANGDAQKYMTEKAELLKTKLEEQKSIVKNAEDALKQMSDNGVSKASVAFQEMQRHVLAAKSGMLDTEHQLETIGDMGVEAGNGVDAMNDQLKRVGKDVSFISVTQGISKITSGLKKAASAAVNLGKKLVDETLGAGQWADELMTDAKVFGISPEELQRMQKTARLIDTPVESIIASKKKLKKARAGESKETMGAFAALGIDPNVTKDEMDLFWQVGEAIMKLGNDDVYSQEDYAQKLLGKSWDELKPLFEAGRKEYEEMNASWNVVTQEQIDKLGDMDDEYQKLLNNFESLKMTALAEFATPMKEAMEAINSLMAEFTEWLKSDEGKQKVQEIMDKVKEGMQFLIDHKEDIFHALEKIALGFAGLKLAEVALNIGKVVSGFKTLFGGSGGGGGTSTTGSGNGGLTGGGFWTGAKNALTGLTTKISNFALANGLQNFLPALGDWFTHNTGIGQELILGTKEKGSTWEGIKQNFVDWGDTALGVAKNNYLFWQNQHETLKGAQEWNLGEDATIEDVMAFMSAQNEAADKINQAAAELSGDTQGRQQANSEMTVAAQGLQGLPDKVANAVKQIQFTIYMSGERMTDYFNENLGPALEAASQ